MQIIEQIMAITILTLLALTTQKWGQELICREQFITLAQYAEISEKTNTPKNNIQTCHYPIHKFSNGWKWKNSVYISRLPGTFFE